MSSKLARLLFSLAAALTLVAVAEPAAAQRRIVPPSREAAQYSFAPIVRMAAPAVVNVYVRSRVKAFVSPFGLGRDDSAP